MVRRIGSVFLLAGLLLSVAACTNKKVQNPIANVGSVQPDKVLFDRAMDAMKHNKFDVARMVLQTLINAYPESEFLARAKLAVGDSWYAQGGSAALAQAENEYKDFITFFPNMPEAAEAQMKIANIHYRQMEKPDRDFTHAKRAEEEYRTMILQYPDSPLLPQATQRLREVQEVLAEREFLIGRFYYLREAYAAALARLQTLVDTYPLYSGADEALYLLGQTYEKQYASIRENKQLTDAAKERIGHVFAQKAADAYARIVSRYPLMARAEDAKARLEALGMPVPEPSEEAIAQNKAEQQSRSETGTWGRVMGTFHRGPDMALAAKVGDPTLADPKQTSAPELMRQTTQAMMRAAMEAASPNAGGTQKVSAEIVKEGATPPPNQPVPRSDAPPTPPPDSGIPELPVAAPANPPAPANAAPAPAPPQVNQVADPQGQSPAAKDAKDSKDSKDKKAAADKNDKNKKDDKDTSSSKKKKKKKLFIF
jgi:outer membrane protein assembly factor BamD